MKCIHGCHILLNSKLFIVRGNRKIFVLLGVFAIDILCWYFNIIFLLFPLGVLYLVLIVIVFSESIVSTKVDYANNSYSWTLVKIIGVLVVCLQVYEFVTLGRYCQGCKAKMWSLYFSNISGVLIALGLMFISPKLNKNKPILFLLVTLSILWGISEPLTEYQLSLPIDLRSGIYTFPVLSPLKDAIYFFLMLYGTLSFGFFIVFFYLFLGGI